MDVLCIPATAETLWWGLQWRHRAARLMPQGNIFCSLTSGILPVEIPHITLLAFMPNSTDFVSLFPQDDVNKIRSGRQKKLVFHPELINQDILDLFPKNVNFCGPSLRLHKQNLCLNLLESTISKSCCRALSRGDAQV